MLQNIYISQEDGAAVQLISFCRILPENTEAVCYQEMTGEFPVYVLERKKFQEKFVAQKEMESNEMKSNEMESHEMPISQKTPDSRNQGMGEERKKEMKSSEPREVSELVRFLDADTYREKMKILESMKEDLNEHMLNNMAVSLDLSLEDGVDGYDFLMSELKIRSRFESKRGDRL